MSGPGRVASEAERGRAVLSLGILAFRWVSLGWMVVLALTAGELRRPALAVAMIAVVVWTAWLTVARPRPTWPVLAADLGLAVALNLVAGLVMPADSVGERPYFAAGYPVAAAVTWGAAKRRRRWRRRRAGAGGLAGRRPSRQRHRPGRRGAGGAARPGRRDAELRARRRGRRPGRAPAGALGEPAPGGHRGDHQGPRAGGPAGRARVAGPPDPRLGAPGPGPCPQARPRAGRRRPGPPRPGGRAGRRWPPARNGPCGR